MESSNKVRVALAHAVEVSRMYINNRDRCRRIEVLPTS
jgi:hypothetical protein